MVETVEIFILDPYFFSSLLAKGCKTFVVRNSCFLGKLLDSVKDGRPQSETLRYDLTFTREHVIMVFSIGKQTQEIILKLCMHPFK